MCPATADRWYLSLAVPALAVLVRWVLGAAREFTFMCSYMRQHCLLMCVSLCRMGWKARTLRRASSAVMRLLLSSSAAVRPSTGKQSCIVHGHPNELLKCLAANTANQSAPAAHLCPLSCMLCSNKVYFCPSAFRAPAAAANKTTGSGADVSVVAAVARLVSERDNAIRASCLNVMEVLYSMEGDGEEQFTCSLHAQRMATSSMLSSMLAEHTGVWLVAWLQIPVLAANCFLQASGHTWAGSTSSRSRSLRSGSRLPPLAWPNRV